LDLFGPLKPDQSFPRAHLLLIKIFSQAFDYHVLALRFFSLVWMLTAFFIWVRLIRADCRDELAAFLCLLAITASYKFSYYASELKPYSMDVLVVAVYALYFHQQRLFETLKPTPRDYLPVVLLPLLMFFSYASLFMFWIVGLNFLWQIKGNREVVKLLAVNAGVSLVCLALFYQFDIRHSITPPGVAYWDGHFISYASFEDFWDKFGDGIRRLVIYPFDGVKPQRYAASIFIPFFVFATFIYGVARLRKDGLRIYHLDSLSLLLFVELFVLGSLQLYPFTGERLTLFMSVPVIMMVVKGITGFVPWPKPRAMLIGYFVIFYLICLVRTIYIHAHYYAS
jgi:hypothetical protein